MVYGIKGCRAGCKANTREKKKRRVEEHAVLAVETSTRFRNASWPGTLHYDSIRGLWLWFSQEAKIKAASSQFLYIAERQRQLKHIFSAPEHSSPVPSAQPTFLHTEAFSWVNTSAEVTAILGNSGS